ncbi:MAG: NADH-quinone oxidoreductase subunit C [Bacteroidaceae bacterium]|nr:NADH-quinone oxidoreductase subunit C [Bacteroidaceae bacterium]
MTLEITTIAPAELHAEMLRLKEERKMDYLRNLIGMDWGEEGLGVIYMLESSETGETANLKTLTADRENPCIPTVSDIWDIANIYEREVFDYFGIKFLNNPDMRRLFLREDWVGYPLRKDDKPEQENPLRMDDEPLADTTTEYFLREDGTLASRQHTIFAPEDYVVNVGPQHPSTHGVLHMRVKLDGETVRKIEPVLGYIHRGIEKISESLTYPQMLAMTDRLDYLSAMQNRHAMCMCIEKAMELEVTPRIQYIRTIMDELQRIASHLIYYACMTMDTGALTAFFYTFREREMLCKIFEDNFGGRLIMNYNTIGGVQYDILPDFARQVKEFCQALRKRFHEYQDIYTTNIIAQQRMIGVGTLSLDEVISRGVTGPSGRASGWHNDVRKRHPYALYDQVEFNEIIRTEGDTNARHWNRMDEILESLHIVEQLIDNIPEGEYQVKRKPIIKLPEGDFYQAVESSRGEFGVFIESKGDKSPYRVHFRSNGLPLVGAMDAACRDQKFADLIAIGASMDFVIPDIDR